MRLGGRALGDRAPRGPAPRPDSWGNQLLVPAFFFFVSAWKLLSALQLDMNLLCPKDATVSREVLWSKICLIKVGKFLCS